MAEAVKVLVIDDDPSLCDIILNLLSNTEFSGTSVHSGRDGLRQLYQVQPDLVLLDLIMPEMDGVDTLKRIRELTDTPVIILTAMSQTDISVRTFEIGADDFIIKPFNKDDLLARMRSVIRRSIGQGARQLSAGYRDEHLVIDLVNTRVLVEGNPVRLTNTEFKFLEYLVSRSGMICTYIQVLESIWGGYAASRYEYLHVYIWKLRQKIERDPDQPEYLVTEHGLGYRFIPKRSLGS